MNPAIKIGCAGWSLNSTQAIAFPGDGSHLERYGAVLSCVEINSSFYRPHQPKTYARWRNSVPAEFRFSVKLPRSITHDARLKESEALMDKFIAEAGCLQEKLACILVQLPPSLSFDADIAAGFFRALAPRTSAALVCEPRHASWSSKSAIDLMREFEISIANVDPPAFGSAADTVAAQIDATRPDPVCYVRLHGSPVIYRSSYADEALDSISERLLQAQAAGRDTWCIFDNTAEGAALPNALKLGHMLQQGEVDR